MLQSDPHHMHTKQKSLSTVLILTSLVGFFILFLPLLLSYLPRSQKPSGNGFSIEIPKIHALSPIVLGVDPWNEAEYKKALRLGVAQAKGTALPGENGFTFLFAHSSGMPWEILGTNAPFLRLGELHQGDTIYIYHGLTKRIYRVSEKKIVSPYEVKFLSDTHKNMLILQTCWPIGTDWERLLVTAIPQAKQQ